MLAFRSMRCALAAEMVTLHHAGEAFAFARADDVDILHAAENFDVHRIAGFFIAGVFEANFLKMSARRDAGLGAVADDRKRAELRLDFIEAELNGVITIALGGLHLRHRAWPSLHDGNGHDATRFVVDSRHADFFS